MKLKIEKISKKIIETKYGPKNKLGILCNNNWYGVFEAPWNKDWDEGDIVDVEVTEREYNGKTYYDIQKPDPMREFDKKLDLIISLLGKSTSGNMPSPLDENDMLNDDIPF